MNRPRISFKKKKLKLNPDPIIVRQGDNIEIELFADLTHSDYSINDILKFKNLKWKLHFKNGNPFYEHEPYTTLEFKTFKREGAPIHSDIVSLGIAENRGEYKFDISLAKGSLIDDSYPPVNPEFKEEEEIIEEVDPIIIVI